MLGFVNSTQPTIWLRRAYKRGLLAENEISILQKIIRELTPKLSAYISSIGKKPLRDEMNETTIKQI